MPRVPTTSPATGNDVPPHYIHTLESSFVDTHGRTLFLRGVNLSGASKAPVGHLSHQLEDFWTSAEEGGKSFNGRPLNLNDGSADVHLARLRGWGFNFLRFPVTWEALEHGGPGIYDEEFIDYTCKVLEKCREYGFKVYMDPHQDTWSRFSGGSGAPFWTLAACGINHSSITATQAAIVHCEYPAAHAPDPGTLPAMIWSTNYGRLLSQTVFTFFFAGQTFAPKCIIDGQNIQDYLQSHYIEAFGRLADRIKAWDNGSLYDDCIIGWDSLNEPFEGLVGWGNLNANPTQQGSTLKKGTYPTPAQSLRLGMGTPQTVENWSFGVFGPSRNGSVTIDPKGYKVWADPVPKDLSPSAGPSSAATSTSELGAPQDPSSSTSGELSNGYHPKWRYTRDVSSWPLGTCPWAIHGVWDIETGFIIRPDYFRFHPETGVEVSFIYDFWKPHFLRWKERISKSHEEAIWLVQPPVFAKPPRFTIEATDELSEDEEAGIKEEVDAAFGAIEGRGARHAPSPPSTPSPSDSPSSTPTPPTAKEGEPASTSAVSLTHTRGLPPPPAHADLLKGRCAYSPHYYDGLTLITKHWNWFNADALGVLRGKYSSPMYAVKFGEGAIRKSLVEQLGILKSDAEILGPYPTVIGEIGTPFDMDGKRSYGYTDIPKGGQQGDGKYKGNYDNQQKALDASLNATEAGGNSLSWTVWTFCGDDHSHAWGDGWNGEDLSLWSLSDVWGAKERTTTLVEAEGDSLDKKELKRQMKEQKKVEHRQRKDDKKDAHKQKKEEKRAEHKQKREDKKAEHRQKKEDKEEKRRQRKEEKKGHKAEKQGDKEEEDEATDEDEEEEGASGWSSSREQASSGITNRKDKRKGPQTQQPEPVSAMVAAAASTLSVASLGSMNTTLADSNVLEPTPSSSVDPSLRESAATSATVSADPSPETSPNIESTIPSTLVNRYVAAQTSTNPSKPSHALLRTLGWHANPFDFLRDGARAYKAFSRPYPVKTIGKVKNMGLDIARASWSVMIEVRAEDAPVAVPGVEHEGAIATEVFLPLVHFAHPRLFGQSAEEIEKARKQLKGSSKSKGRGEGESKVGLLEPSSTSLSLSKDSSIASLPLPSPSAVSLPFGAEPETSKSKASPPLRRPFGKHVQREVDAAVRRGGAGIASGQSSAAASVISLGESLLSSQSAIGVQPVVPFFGLSASDVTFDAELTTNPVSTGSSETVSSSSSSIKDDAESSLIEEALDAYPYVPSNDAQDKDDDEDDDWDDPTTDADGVPWEDGPLVDVEVTVSEGTWKIEGQALWWWYEVPDEADEVASNASQVDVSKKGKQAKDAKAITTKPGVKQVRLEIKRRGGPIKKEDEERSRAKYSGASTALNLSGVVGPEKSSASLVARRGQGKGGDTSTLCEDMCPQDCRVM